MQYLQSIDYVVLTGAIADARKEAEKICDPGDAELLGAEIATASISDTLADYFQKDNPQFDRWRFIVACGCGGREIRGG